MKAWFWPLLYCLLALGALVLPLCVLVLRSLGLPGGFTLGHYMAYFATPGLSRALWNTALLGILSVLVVVPLAFLFAYGLERTRLPLKAPLAALAAIPLLVPSLLPALALVYLFGRQGLLAPLLRGGDIYGLPGVLAADAIAAFPHALIVLGTALSAADGRLYEQAALLGAGPWRIFRTVTLPGARHGLAAAALVVFALTITDIGAPKVVGGDFDVLAIVIYKQVLGQQHFELGSVAAILLMLPSMAAIALERWAARRQAALLSARSRRFVPRPGAWRDGVVGTVCFALAGALLAMLATCQLVALVRLWPYDLSLTSLHYELDRYDGGGWAAVGDSMLLAAMTAITGTIIAFCGAYAGERLRGAPLLRGLFLRLALLPAAVPGLALGLCYVLFFDDPANPLHVLYGTAALLVIANVTHYYTVAHLTALSAVKAVDRELEAAARALGRSPFSVLTRVMVPVAAPALGEIALYLFVNAMTTVSVVMFLYPPGFKLASVAVLNMDDAGDLAPAAAMGMMIFYVNLAVRLLGQWAIARLRAPRPAAVAVPEAVA